MYNLCCPTAAVGLTQCLVIVVVVIIIIKYYVSCKKRPTNYHIISRVLNWKLLPTRRISLSQPSSSSRRCATAEILINSEEICIITVQSTYRYAYVHNIHDGYSYMYMCTVHTYNACRLDHPTVLYLIIPPVKSIFIFRDNARKKKFPSVYINSR